MICFLEPLCEGSTVSKSMGLSFLWDEIQKEFSECTSSPSAGAGHRSFLNGEELPSCKKNILSLPLMKRYPHIVTRSPPSLTVLRKLRTPAGNRMVAEGCTGLKGRVKLNISSSSSMTPPIRTRGVLAVRPWNDEMKKEYKIHIDTVKHRDIYEYWRD